MRNGKVEVYRSKGQWRWRIIAPNGRKLANSGESYKRRGDCIKSLNTVITDAVGWDWTVDL